MNRRKLISRVSHAINTAWEENAHETYGELTELLKQLMEE